MASEQEHDVPGFGRVRVVDTESAAAGLRMMVQRFRDGTTEPLIFGDEQPEAVVIPFDVWLHLLLAVEDAEASARIQETTRERLSTPQAEYVPLDELGIRDG
jgi:hypothetical protein